MTYEINKVETRVRSTNKQRRARRRAKRIREIRMAIYNFLCWLERVLPIVRKEAKKMPRKIAQTAVHLACICIFLLLFLAFFFAASGILYMAFKFWVLTYLADLGV